MNTTYSANGHGQTATLKLRNIKHVGNEADYNPQKTSRLTMGPTQAKRPKILQAI